MRRDRASKDASETDPLAVAKLREQVERFDADNRTRPDAVPLALDVYLLASYTDHPGLLAALEAASVATAIGSVEQSQTAQGPLVFVAGSVHDDAGPVLDYQVTAAASGQSNAHVRMWAQTQDGILLVERLLHGANGGSYPLAQGIGRCTVDPRSVFAPIIGERPCDIGETSPGKMAFTGRAYFFPGIAAGD